MNNNTPTPEVRLQAKKRLLEQQALMHKMRLQNNVAYAKKHVPAIAGAEVTKSLDTKSPLASRALKSFLPKPKNTRISRVSRNGIAVAEAPNPGVRVDRILSIAGWVLPLLFGFARRRAFKYGLKGVRDLSKFAFKRIFKR